MKRSNCFFYLYIQKMLLEICNYEKKVKFKDAKAHFTNFRIKKDVGLVILKEMIDLNLIERVDRYTFKIINCSNCKEVDNLNKFSHKIGIW